MLEIFSLTDEECERLAKGIAVGVFLGTILGLILKNVELLFAIGGVVGIVVTVLYSYFIRLTLK